MFPAAVHEAHVFTRAVSTSDDGRVIFGCTFGRCAATEIRRADERSPFALKREAAKRAAATRRGRPR